jgi:hypothetical protein
MNYSMLSDFTEAERCVGATKAEAVGESHTDAVLLSSIGHVVAVKVNRRISWVFEIESRRQDVLIIVNMWFVPKTTSDLRDAFQEP